MQSNNHFSSRGKFSRRQVNSEINVTPFVDVMLVLLVIFMVTSPMTVTGIVTDLPEHVDKPVVGNDQPITVEVDSNGLFYFQEKKLSFKDLVRTLHVVSKNNPDARIFVRGSRNVRYGKIIQAIDSINKAGFKKVALITEIRS
jgi:biopolymer transport protein TolR